MASISSPYHAYTGKFLREQLKTSNSKSTSKDSSVSTEELLSDDTAAQEDTSPSPSCS